MGGSSVWSFHFSQNLHDHEVTEDVRLLSLLNKIYLSGGQRDVEIWMPDAKGHFSVKSFYNVLIGVGDRMVGWKRFWNPFVPLRIVVFCWVARLHKILTMDQLRRKFF